MTGDEFEPDWTIAPAAFLRRCMRDNGGMTIGQLAIVAGRGESDFKAGLLIRDVLARRPFGQAAAEVLEADTGVQARLWLRMETRYREDLAMGRTESPEDDDD